MKVSNQKLEEAIKNLDFKWLVRKEIKELPGILWENEIPEKAVQGVYQHKQGILVATNKRLIFIDKGFFSLTVEDFPYDKISSIQYTTGIIFGELTFYASGNKGKIGQVDKMAVRSFAEWVRNHIEQAKENETTNPQPSGGYSSPVEQLKQLAELKNQGILTEEEFQDQKKKILGS
ncbi:PH domain-containing protein [Desmospora activa]|uniref:Putative oligomerization/nucleic acid binding protein n=1 Tax=Desmospora activa DSM 45169 TaxID=1121389 RepID=A0A2T4ZCF9_9BACL|nr:PH domain-containing protein [Desmospora activa]PTM59574.1 putative oligomerization/nucleic acid binding protein [Desmospora activa DSM 45169]